MDSQHPGHSSVQLSIDALQVRQGHLLFEDHFVEADDEVGVEESSMEDAKTKAASDELEIVQMLWIHPGSWINLESVVVVCRVLKQAVEWIKHFVG